MTLCIDFYLLNFIVFCLFLYNKPVVVDDVFAVVVVVAVAADAFAALQLFVDDVVVVVV